MKVCALEYFECKITILLVAEYTCSFYIIYSIVSLLTLDRPLNFDNSFSKYLSAFFSLEANSSHATILRCLDKLQLLMYKMHTIINTHAYFHRIQNYYVGRYTHVHTLYDYKQFIYNINPLGLKIVNIRQVCFFRFLFIIFVQN